MANKQASKERKERVAEMQRAQKARETRTRIRIIAAAATLLLVLVAVSAYAVIDGRSHQPDQALSAIGVSASAASCSAITNDPASGNGEHVGPGTNKPNVTKVKYATVPPEFGQHFASPDLSGRKFFTTADAPKVETLVHNLEHGYTVLWYSPSVSAAKIAVLKDLADTANKTSWATDKFIVAPWDASYGAFPAGKSYALSHWSATLAGQNSGDSTGGVTKQEGHGPMCGDVSGAVVKTFISQFPKTDAPEPNAA